MTMALVDIDTALAEIAATAAELRRHIIPVDERWTQGYDMNAHRIRSALHDLRSVHAATVKETT